MKKQLILLALMLLPMLAGAVEVKGINYELKSGNYAWVVAKTGSNYTGDIDIPETFQYGGKTYTVNGIGDDAFWNCKDITSVKMPNTIYYIGTSAFQGCSKLGSVNLPTGLMYLYTSFGSCESLTSIHIPAKVVMLGDDFVYGCNNLTEITVDSKNEYFESPEGSNCIINKETKELVVGCKTTVIPDGVTSIGSSAFRGVAPIESMPIPNSVTSIGNFAFGNIDNLSKVVIPNSVTTIGYAAFCYAKQLKEVTIGKGVEKIELDAFGNCPLLKDVKLLAQTPPTIFFTYDTTSELDAFSSYRNPSLRTGITLHVPASALAAYKADSYWSTFKEVVALPNKCETPVITVKDGQVTFTCDTEDVEFKASISREFTGEEVDPEGSYTLSVYATKEDFEDSDVATMLINLGRQQLTGDVNGDGKVTITDAVTVVNIILGKSGTEE